MHVRTYFLPEHLPLSAVTIYHNQKCETSRNTLAMIRNSNIEPTIIEYLQQPPSREQLVGMIKDAGLSVRGALREKGTPYAELGLGDPKLTDEQLLDAMILHPILINRPFVITERGTRLCREDGEVVIDSNGQRVPESGTPIDTFRPDE